MVQPEEIVEYARTWIGTKWVHQGRSDTGVDCAGLLMRTAQHFDLDGKDNDLIGYRRAPGELFMANIRKATLRARPTVPVHGAIGVFHDSLMPCHTGIFAVDSAGKITVIHSEAFPKKRVHEESYTDSTQPLCSRLVDIRLFKDVNYEC